MKTDIKKILHDHLKKIGKKGGEITKNRHGSAHFSRIGKKSRKQK